MSITSALPPLAPNRRYPLDQANQYLGQSRAKTCQNIAKENLRVIKDGSRTYIPAPKSFAARPLRADGHARCRARRYPPGRLNELLPIILVGCAVPSSRSTAFESRA